MHTESGIIEGEKVEKLAHNEREDSRSMGPILEVVAIHEEVFSAGMSMQVTAHDDITLPVEVSYHTLDVPVYRVQILGRYAPPAIQVLTGKRAPVVSVDDTIWIKHRHDFEHKVLTKGLRLWRIAHKELYDALHHPTGV